MSVIYADEYEITARADTKTYLAQHKNISFGTNYKLVDLYVQGALANSRIISINWHE